MFAGERLSGQSELRHVIFGLSPAEPPLLEDWSLTIAPGTRIAIAGGSGSGKTKLGEIAWGLLEVWGGALC